MKKFDVKSHKNFFLEKIELNSIERTLNYPPCFRVDYFWACKRNRPKTPHASEVWFGNYEQFIYEFNYEEVL